MNMHRTMLVVLLSGCTKLTSLGISNEHIVGRDSATNPATHYSALTIGRGELMLPNGYVGDIDGDGLDDVLIGGMQPSGPSSTVPDMTVYLFYGRAAFPEMLSAADADATFDTGALDALTLGDINGDGFADFILGDGTGYEFVFGSKQRFTGHHAKFTSGPKWSYGEPPRPEDFFAARFYRVYPLGDLNGDGAADFSIQLSERSPLDSQTAFKDYLFEGRKGAWPSGAWDPSWAAASFSAADAQNDGLAPWSTGDFDGDGKNDLIARQNERYWLFYGRSAGLRGSLTAAEADAELKVGDAYPIFGGDLDADGADDLQVQSAGELQIVYGSRARYTGAVAPAADLTFAGMSGGAQVVDLNADGLNDLLVTASSATAPSGPFDERPSIMYKVRGDGTRLTGRYQLQPEQRYQPIGYEAPEPLETGRYAFIDGRSDFDGDGSSDLMMVYLEDVAPDQHGAVYVLPGNSREPD